MKNKLLLLLIPLFLIFVSCTTDPTYEYRHRIVALSSDAKSYKCNQNITLTLSRSQKKLSGQTGGVLSIYKKNSNNGYALYPDYTIDSDDSELMKKGDASCVFLIDLEKLDARNHFYLSIPDAGDYKVTMSLFKTADYDLYEEQYYVEFSVTE